MNMFSYENMKTFSCLEGKKKRYSGYQNTVNSSVQFSRCRVWFFVTPWIAARQASLSIINSQNLLKLMSIESVMPSNHLILCRPLFLLPSIFPSIRVFSNESALCIRWPKYWSFSFNISPFNDWCLTVGNAYTVKLIILQSMLWEFLTLKSGNRQKNVFKKGDGGGGECTCREKW